jgi:hypothetical protein
MSKGIMFSIIIFFIAMTLIGLIVIQRNLIFYSRENIFIEMRINAINNHYDSVIRDLGKTIETITQRAIIVCLNNISQDFVSLQNANVTIKGLIINGTLDQNEVSLMKNATIEYWIKRIKEISTLRGFDVYIDTEMINRTLTIKPYNSFYLLVEADMQINITDMQGVAGLNRTTRISKTVSIEGLEDPLYTFQFMPTNYVWESLYVGNYTQLILSGSGGCTVNCYEYGTATQDSTFPNFQNKILVVNNANLVANLDSAKAVVSEVNIIVPINIPYVIHDDAITHLSEGMNVLLDVNAGQGNVWYIDNFKKHVEKLYYQSSQNGASYLDRLEGKLEKQTKYSSQSNNEIGLESFINKNKIPSGMTVNMEKTNIDYIYFSTSSVNGDKVKGISNSNWFRIDDSHQPTYGIDVSLIE